MRSVLLTLMMSVTQVQLSPCPSSCVVCTQDATICTKLSSIIEVPESTKAFLLTNGWIDSVDSTALVNIHNVSVLVLSYNIISTITTNAFQNLTILKTLLLDHNKISSPALTRITFSWMHNLETLHLGHNALREVHGTWFEKSYVLKTLLLPGNFLTNLSSNTFASSDLRSLEILDLSGNLISHVDRESFRTLPLLRNLDLSRNKLKAMPNAFGTLLHLTVLNLGLNEWNCSCPLVDLASFLRNFPKTPETLRLYDGQSLVCTGSDNPSIQTVLKLTVANCSPVNDANSVRVVGRRSITAHRYTRDVTLAAVFACLGGSVITLTILAIIQRKKCKSCEGKLGLEDQSSQGSVHWNFSEGKDALSMSCPLPNNHSATHQPWDKDNSLFSPAPDFTENMFICYNCGSENLKPSSRREIIQHLRRKEASPDRTGRDQVDRHQTRTKGSRNSRGSSTIKKPPSRRFGSDTMTKTFQNEGRIHCSHSHNEFFKRHIEENPTIYQTHNCSHCHDAYEYKQIQEQDRTGKLHGSRVILYRNAFNHTPANVSWHSDGHTQIQRSVSFDLSIVPNHETDGPYRIHRTKILRTLEQEQIPKTAKTNRAKSNRKVKIPEHQITGKKKLKMKFNLNPFKKTRNQVYPKSGSQDVVDADGAPKKEKTPKSQMMKVKKKSECQSKGKPKKHKATEKDEEQELKRVSKQGGSELIDNSEDAPIAHLTQDSYLPPSSLEDTKTHLEDSGQLEFGSNLVAEITDMTLTNPLSINLTDTSRVPNQSSDLPPSSLEIIVKHLEDSEQLELGSNLVAESTATALTHPLSMITSIHASNMQSSQTSLPQSSELLASQPFSPLNLKDDQPQEEAVSTSEIQNPSDESITPVFFNYSVVQEYPSSGGASPKRKIRLVVPEKSSSRPQSALDKKIR